MSFVARRMFSYRVAKVLHSAPFSIADFQARPTSVTFSRFTEEEVSTTATCVVCATIVHMIEVIKTHPVFFGL